jgi:methylase of polypeptide subunit release factors
MRSSPKIFLQLNETTLLSRSERGAGGEGLKPRYEYFRKVLAEMAKHPNPRYFVLKSIMLNNLYGVDIMEEATEICKLRLFLKLVAQMEPQPKKENFGLEPLPDIDFNIRAGNTLVGFSSLEEVRKAIKQDGSQLNLDLQDDASRMNEKAELADRAFQRFRQMQTEFGMDAGDFRSAKKELRRRLAELNDELNHYLAREYGIDVSKPAAFEKWRDSHQPFHWFVEFYSIIDRGGFDVIIGNPPYVEYKKIIKQYQISKYDTESCGNLYSYVLEQCLRLSTNNALLGMIIPMSAFSTDRMKPLSEQLYRNSNSLWISNYGVRPSKLFDGVNWRLSIVISSIKRGNSSRLCLTKHYRWYSEERETILSNLEYSELSLGVISNPFPKFSEMKVAGILEKLTRNSSILVKDFTNHQRTEGYIHYQEATQYWIKAMDRLPCYYERRYKLRSSKPTHYYIWERSHKISLMNQ